MEENKSIAESVGLQEFASQNPEVQHLMEMLNSQNMSFDEFVNSDPELQQTMKVLTEDNIKLAIPSDDDDVEEDEEEVEDIDLGGLTPGEVDLTNDSPEPATNTNFVENTETAAAVSDDLNSIF